MMEVFDFEQGSPEWFACRMGIPTSSEFATVMAKNRSGKGRGLTCMTYMRKLAGEILTGEPMDNYSNAHMERGKEMEGEARKFYAYMTDLEPLPVGFIKSGDRGTSPDSLIDEDGILEIKTKLPHLLIDVILKDDFPPDHKAQCQGQLWVAEREWLDLIVYWPGMPPFIKRATRDEDYIKTLAEEVDRFNYELNEMVERVRAYGRKAAA